MVNFEQIQVGISNYFNNEIISKTSGFNQFKYGFIKGAIMDKVPKIIAAYKDSPMIKSLNIIDNQNMVDIDSVYKWAKESVQHSGQFMVGGLIFNETDIDKLYNYITNNVI